MSLIVKSTRINSIDLIRGLVMILMTLDHVRDYFHADAFFFKPTDLSQTNIALFFTRWVTHFCAPVFVFLAGTSAFIAGQKMSSKKELSVWLLKRGGWLIFLELTVVKFAWTFQLDYHYSLLIVIWALGFSMVVLAGLIHLPMNLQLILGLVIIAGHNMFDDVKKLGHPFLNGLWTLLHETHKLKFGNVVFSVGYPVLPWIGLMTLGYCLGQIYTTGFDEFKRKKILISLGFMVIFIFLLLRISNFYGDPSLWSIQASNAFTFLSILNTSKYPPSLLYLCMTIGPALLFLAFAEHCSGWLSEKIITIGKAPLFFYLIHIFVIHLLACIAALITGYGWQAMIIERWVTRQEALKGYGFGLGTVYLIWLGIIAGLFFVCQWYTNYKSNHRNKWWLSYL